jgi:two-component system NtrC family sensor kinase
MRVRITLCTSVLTLTTLAAGFAPSLKAQDAPQDASTVTFTTEDTWKSLSLEMWRFKTGDSLEWVDPDYDDSGWRLLNTRTEYDSLIAFDWPGIGWWRIHIVADSATNDWYPLLFLNQQAGATEAFLNGKRVFLSGKPSGDPELERTINREEVAPLDLRPGENVLAVRYSYTQALKIYDLFRDGWPPGPSVVLTEGAHWQFERRPVRRFGTTIFSWVGGALFMMFLVHLLLFLFNRADRTNLFFALFAGFLLSIPVNNALEIRFPSLPLEGTWLFIIVGALQLTALIMLVAAVHQLFYRRLLRIFWVLAAAIAVSYVVRFLEWNGDVPIVTIAVGGIMLELLRVTFTAIWKRMEGGRVIGVGVAAMIGLWILAMTGLVPGITAGPMMAMTFPISVSVLLATRAATRNRRLEDQQRLISQHAEHLEEQVEERTTQLKHSLEDLKNTQDQLIQAEKMASLGSLTAGIAHEIKNPLNFINNFAEVNEELAQELKEAIAKGETVDDILTDLEQNASVIAEHGKRADSIVRSMMQHARGGTGERETVDINTLVGEYVGLAYHGKRAQLPDFNATIEENYDENVGSLSIVPQDFGRVLLNLLGNAFDAVSQRREKGGGRRESVGEKTEEGEYQPQVAVSTVRKNGQIEVRVSDNGPGVPEEIRAKIFEPFFTTKPTGSGTGVGLSLSYDIITQGHGGSLRVESSDQGGAEFVVTLPVDSNGSLE